MLYRWVRCRPWAAVEGEAGEGEEERLLERGRGAAASGAGALAVAGGAWSGAGAAAGAAEGADEALFSAGGVLLHPQNITTPTRLTNNVR